MIIRITNGPAAIGVVATLLLSGCGDATAPTPPALTAEQVAIAAAAADAGALSGRGGGHITLALSQVGDRGRLGTFDAFGVVVAYDLPDATAGSGRDVGWFTGIVGYSGLDVSARTVAELISAGAGGSGTSALTNGSVQIGQFVNDREGVALFARQSPKALYVGTSGTFTVQTVTFGAPRQCGTATGAAAPITCSYSIGTMTGSLDFVAGLASGTGAATSTQAQTSFTLPAIRVSMVAQ